MIPAEPRLLPEAGWNLALGGLRVIVEYLHDREDFAAADELEARRRAESLWSP